MTEAIKTEGQRLLLALPEAPSEVAKKLGASKAQISQWRRGHRVPTGPWRARLLDRYAIPIGAWDSISSVTAATRTPEEAPVRSPQPSAPVATPSAPTGSGALAEVNAHLARLKADLDSTRLTSAERSRMSDVYTRALAVKARLERDAEMTEDRIVRDHPAWKGLRAALLDALRPHRLALEDVLRAIGGES